MLTFPTSDVMGGAGRDVASSVEMGALKSALDCLLERESRLGSTTICGELTHTESSSRPPVEPTPAGSAVLASSLEPLAL